MSNRIDQFFKDALSEHKVAPSAEAWTKVQSGITKKNKLIIVWRMAAAFLLMGALMGTWYFSNSDHEINTQAMLTEVKEVTTPELDIKGEPIESAHEIPQNNLIQSAKPESQKDRNKYRVQTKTDKNSLAETNSMDHRESANQEEESMITENPVLIAQTVQTTEADKPLVIEFTLSPIVHEPTTEVAQNDSESTSALKKILETARDVKNGESDLGIIRDAKNQLLAFDFKKDKTKRN